MCVVPTYLAEVGVHVCGTYISCRGRCTCVWYLHILQRQVYMCVVPTYLAEAGVLVCGIYVACRGGCTCVWYLRILQRQVYMCVVPTYLAEAGVLVCVVPSSSRLPTRIEHSNYLTGLLLTKVAGCL